MLACCAQGPVFKPSTNSRQTVRSFLPALLVWIRGEAALRIKAPFTDALVISSGVLAAAALQGLGVKWVQWCKPHSFPATQEAEAGSMLEDRTSLDGIVRLFLSQKNVLFHIPLRKM